MERDALARVSKIQIPFAYTKGRSGMRTAVSMLKTLGGMLNVTRTGKFLYFFPIYDSLWCSAIAT